MSDYLRKPAPGTTAREAWDLKHTRSRALCACRSGHPVRPGMNQCIACHPATATRYAEMTRMHKGSKQ